MSELVARMSGLMKIHIALMKFTGVLMKFMSISGVGISLFRPSGASLMFLAQDLTPTVRRRKHCEVRCQIG